MFRRVTLPKSLSFLSLGSVRQCVNVKLSTLHSLFNTWVKATSLCVLNLPAYMPFCHLCPPVFLSHRTRTTDMSGSLPVTSWVFTPLRFHLCGPRMTDLSDSIHSWILLTLLGLVWTVEHNVCGSVCQLSQ